MDCEQVYFANFTRDYAYSVVDTKIRFLSVLSPLLEMIQHKLKGNYLYAEEYLMQFLQQHRKFISSEDILDLSRHMSTCVAHIYVIIITLILSIIIGIPLVCCMDTCFKRVTNPKKHKYCFCIEGVLFFAAICFLAIGTASSWYIGLQTQNVMEKFPGIMRDMINDYDNILGGIEADGGVLNDNITSTLNLISKTTMSMPDEIVQIIDRNLNRDYRRSITKFKESVLLVENIYETLDFSPDTSYISKLNKLDNKLEQLLKNIVHEIIDANNAIDKNGSIDAKDKSVFTRQTDLIVQDMIYSSHKLPNWTKIFDNLYTVRFGTLPKIEKNICFVSTLHEDIDKAIADDSKKVLKYIRNTQDLLKVATTNMTSAMRLVIPESIKRAILNATLKIDGFLSKMNIPRDIKTSKFYKSTTWLFLFPSIYGFVILFLMCIAFSGTCRELHNVSNGNLTKTEFVILSYKCAMFISIVFLWLILSLAAIAYCLHIPATVACGVIKKDKLFSQYLDKNVWDNDSWLGYKLKNVVPSINHSLRVRDVLDKCHQNETIIASLDLNEYVTNNTDPSKINFNLTVVKHNIEDLLDKKDLPDISDVNDVIRRMATIDHELDLRFVPKLVDDIKLLHESNLPHRIMDVVYYVPVSLQTMMAIKTKVNQALEVGWYILEEVRQLLKTKFLVTKVKDNFEELKQTEMHLKNLLINKSKLEIWDYLYDLSANIFCVAEKTMNFTRTSLTNKIGNCYILPLTYDKAVWMFCDYGLSLLTTAWLALSLTSFSIVIALLLSCRVLAYVRGAHKIYIQSQHMDERRYSSQRAMFNNDIKELMVG